jgi:hypothetical protein
MPSLSARGATGVAVATVMLAGAVAGCGDVRSALSACTAADEQLAAVLGDLPLLEVHPPSATSMEKYSNCTTDGGYAEAGHQYRTNLDRQAILSFYIKAATADGWIPSDPEASPPASLVITASAGCFTKELDGATDYLRVRFPNDTDVTGDPASETPSDVYAVEVSGSHDEGAAGC